MDAEVTQECTERCRKLLCRRSADLRSLLLEEVTDVLCIVTAGVTSQVVQQQRRTAAILLQRGLRCPSVCLKPLSERNNDWQLGVLRSIRTLPLDDAYIAKILDKQLRTVLSVVDRLATMTKRAPTTSQMAAKCRQCLVVDGIDCALAAMQNQPKCDADRRYLARRCVRIPSFLQQRGEAVHVSPEGPERRR